MDILKANNLQKSKTKKVQKLSQEHILKMHEKVELDKRVRYDKPECVFCDYKKSKKSKPKKS